MNTIAEIADWLQTVAPLELSESWDNTGLLLGDPKHTAQKVLTCLTLTPTTVAEAIEFEADLVIAHHPLPFKPLQTITTLTGPGNLVWQLASHGIAVYAPHTAWDSARLGINQRLANKLELQSVQPLIPADSSNSVDGARENNVGTGRCGILAEPLVLTALAQRLADLIPAVRARGVASKPDRLIGKVAIACGSGGSLLSAALPHSCDVFVTGEATFHTCLEAEAAGIDLLMIGHFASERFAMDHLAEELSAEFKGLNCLASQNERDPVVTF